MKRLQLTDEEVRLIESRRKDEARFNAGWNSALDYAINAWNDGGMTHNEYLVFMNEAKRVVKV